LDGPKLVDGIDDAHFADQPFPGSNHPAWIIGHLAICTDYVLDLLGKPKAMPPGWHTQFGPGSTVVADRAAYPSKAELMDALAGGHAAAGAAAAEAPAARLDEPTPVPLQFLQENIPTVGAMLLMLLCTHEGVHLGQLSAWRRQHGLPGVLAL